MRALLVVLLCAISARCLASSSTYDREEEIRRASEKLVEYDRQERQAAKDRADEKERLSHYDPNDNSSLAWVLILAGGILYVLFKIAAHQRHQRSRTPPTLAPVASARGSSSPLFRNPGANRTRAIELSHSVLINFLNLQLSRGHSVKTVEGVFWNRWRIDLRIVGDRLQIDNDSAIDAAMRFPEIEAFFATLPITPESVQTNT